MYFHLLAVSVELELGFEGGFPHFAIVVTFLNIIVVTNVDDKLAWSSVSIQARDERYRLVGKLKELFMAYSLVSNDLHIPKISVCGHSIRVISAYQLLVTSV